MLDFAVRPAHGGHRVVPSNRWGMGDRRGCHPSVRGISLSGNILLRSANSPATSTAGVAPGDRPWNGLGEIFETAAAREHQAGDHTCQVFAQRYAPVIDSSAIGSRPASRRTTARAMPTKTTRSNGTEPSSQIHIGPPRMSSQTGAETSRERGC